MSQQLTPELVAQIIAEMSASKRHFYPCFECGCKVLCGNRGECSDTVCQCRACHEGCTANEYNRTRAQAFGITDNRRTFPRPHNVIPVYSKFK